MDNKYKLHYHVNQDGSAEVLCELLDCFEQPCYFQYKKVSDGNPWIFFCGNINLIFCLRNEMTLGTIVSKTREQYSKIQTVSISSNCYAEITKLLKKYGEIILTTAFNYVNDYVWYKDEGKLGMHTQHCTYLLGENEKDYFIVDNPYVLLNSEKISLRNNNSIFVIPKSNFQEAFEKCCIVTTLKYHNLPNTKESELAYFINICKEIVKDYEGENSVESVIFGRQALSFLKNELEKGNEKLIDDFYVFHMVMARRIIFKRCINILKVHIFNSNQINKYLRYSIELWKMMKELAFKHHYYNESVHISAANKVGEIIKVEDALIDTIANIL